MSPGGSRQRPVDPSGVGARLRAFVGASTAAPDVARDSVNLPMIRHWCDAIGDTNPVYGDAEYAASSVHGGIVAPPTMLQAWVLPGLAPPAEKPSSNVLARIVAELDEAGFTGVVATDCEQEYTRYLRPGDRPSLRTSIDEVSELKQTALGAGYFVTSGMSFFDQADQPVGRMRFRILKFRPSEGAQAAPDAPAPRWPRPALNSDNRFFWDGVARGELPIQRCGDCDRLRHPPRPMCPHCQSTEWRTQPASGRGTVHSFVVVHHPPVPPFEYPLVVVLAELEEGIRLVANLDGVEPDDVKIGMPLELDFVTVEEGVTLPRFVLAGAPKRWSSRGAAEGTAPAGPEVQELQPRSTTLRIGEVSEGERLPTLSIPLTTTLIIATAVASRDYQDVHHDRDAARQAGSKDVFMNILSTNGFVGRYVTDWAGPEAVLKRVSLRLGAPNYPGDTMRLSGTVTRREAGTGEVELEVIGRNAYGDHVRAAVVAGLPA